MWGWCCDTVWEGVQKASYIAAEGANIAGNILAPLWKGSYRAPAVALAVILGGVESLNTWAFQVRKAWGKIEDSDSRSTSTTSSSSSVSTVDPERGCASKTIAVIRCQEKSSTCYHSLSVGYWGFLGLKALVEIYFTLSALLGWYHEFSQGDQFDGDSTPFIGWQGLLLMGLIVVLLRFPFDATTDGQSVDEALAEGLHPAGETVSGQSACGLDPLYRCLSRNAFVRAWVSRMGSAWHVAEHVADVILMLPAKELGELDWKVGAIIALAVISLVFCILCVCPTAGQTCLFEGNEACDMMRKVGDLPEKKSSRWMPKGASCLLKTGMRATGPSMHGSGTAASVYVATRTMTGSRPAAWAAALVFGGASGNGFRRTELVASTQELRAITVQTAEEGSLT